jgi:hypothetical protein
MDNYLTDKTEIHWETASCHYGLRGTELKKILTEAGFTKRAPTKWYDKNNVRQNQHTSKLTDFTPTDKPLVITSYLVGSKVHKPFWDILTKFVNLKDAQLLVLPMRYHNPTMIEETLKQDEEAKIDPLVIPFLCLNRFDYGMTKVLADIKINPTNLEPINTLTSFSYGKHLVVGHSTQQIKSLTTGKYEKTLTAWSTGSCSFPELSDSLAGKKAELHHRYGFVFLSKTSIRSIHARRDGSFIDQGTEYKEGSILPAAPLACVMGDLHFGQTDIEAYQWAKNTAKDRNCKFLLLNDSFDGSTVNHHVKSLAERTERFDFVTDELNNHKKEIKALEEEGFTPYLVHSNHTDFLTRWAQEVHPDQVHHRDRFLYQQLRSRQDIISLLDTLLGCVTLEKDFMCGDFRIVHGHERFNGARGSIKSYNQTGTRTAYGHTHKIESLCGHENVGCLCVLDQDYVMGFSSGIHSIGFIYPNGKFQHEVKW